MAKSSNGKQKQKQQPPRPHLERHLHKARSTGTSIRRLLLAICCGYYVQKLLKPYLLPYGPAWPRPPMLYASIDYNNTVLQQFVSKLPVPDVHGPETVVMDTKHGTMYLLSEDAQLIRVNHHQHHQQQQQQTKNETHVNQTTTTTTTIVANLGMGRPLGGRIAHHKTNGDYLYVADTLLGLVRYPLPTKKQKQTQPPRVELLTHTVNNGTSPIQYANDVAIGPNTGIIYFTDSTDIAPERTPLQQSKHKSSSTWDTLFASKQDLVRGRAKGRLLSYHPTTGVTTVLLDHLYFPNGIAVHPDESKLYFCETFGMRIREYDLRTGVKSTLLDSPHFPGYPDGLDCNDTYCYAVLPSAIVPLHKLWNVLPFSELFRTLILSLPKFLAPPVKTFGGVVRVNVHTREHVVWLDPTGQHVGMLTGATLYQRKLYLGSLKNKYIGVLDLNDVEK